MAQLKVLGCSGGIGGDYRTTSLLLDHDILIDAGSGVGDLSMDELLKISHIFVTHSHLDHIAFIPLLLDTVMGIRSEPITLYATQETLAILQAHIFNWKIWPDFNAIPNATAPFLRYQEIKLGQPVVLGGRTITALPVHHVVPAVGYHIKGAAHSLVYTGDTTICDALWHAVNNINHLKYLIVETAFSNSELELAVLSKHLCPSMLLQELAKLNAAHLTGALEVYITHLKPGEDAHIMREIAAGNAGLSIKALNRDQVFEL
ncbi:3',5'-cyclic-nucleotide phosphodiesterase [Methylotenera mobilis]|uniref:Beta-lactamase domain protein n=1 Tax=Methylotenera mobilis (strain JLW8 / ATCC BAA-1282 / DSM 17540) TaxID=583345 RepID=C6WUB9_METML|nr:3',5'-cyclic-nucleotide phosphodiesterase [Methylotenera mobilis]ACT47518.1 beta-lactamase domain protein [Methylotenera mobilis JLW8]